MINYLDIINLCNNPNLIPIPHHPLLTLLNLLNLKGIPQHGLPNPPGRNRIGVLPQYPLIDIEGQLSLSIEIFQHDGMIESEKVGWV